MKVLPRNTIIEGDARTVLPGLPPESVDTCITSPPYVKGLRNYGTAGQLGQEPSVSAYVENLVGVLRLVRRVLKPTGSLWLNLGDGYAKHSWQGAPPGGLLLAPQRVTLALAADNWLIRNVCVWQKPNPKPESARDRLSQTYEVVILATTGRHYFFDLDGIRVPHKTIRFGRPQSKEGGRLYQGKNDGLGKLKAEGRVGHRNGKNPGDVWTVPTAVDRLGHQATFPERLIEPMILSTCPERICVQCDTAWMRPVRIVTRQATDGGRHAREVGELRRCDCFAPSRPGVVLDPFMGTGTTAAVARQLGRDFVGVELNPRYIALANERLAGGRLRGGQKGHGLSARRKSQPLPKGAWHE